MQRMANKERIGKNETMAMVLKEDKNEKEGAVFYIRSYYGHYLSFDVSDSQLCCQKVSHSMTSWRRHSSRVYAKFSSNDLFYFTPSSTAGIIGSSGISIYGNKFLSVDANGTVSNKVIPGKHEMWIIEAVDHELEAADDGDVGAVDAVDAEQQPLDETLFAISNLVRSNSECLDVYRSQIETKEISIDTMKDWSVLYHRLLRKRTEWMDHRNALQFEGKEREKEDDDPFNAKHCKLGQSLDLKHTQKWEEMEEVKQSVDGHDSALNALRSSMEETSLMLSERRDALKECEDEIAALQQKLSAAKKKRSEYLQEMNNVITPKLEEQTKCVAMMEEEVNASNANMVRLEKELASIRETKVAMNRLDENISFILDFLDQKLKVFSP